MGPTLADVLASGATASTFNPLYLLLGLAACLVAAVTLVKGREIFRRSPDIPDVLAVKPCLEDLRYRERIDKLTFMVNELKHEREQIAASNAALQAELAAKAPEPVAVIQVQKAKRPKAKAKGKKETSRKPNLPERSRGRRVSRKGK
jgi:hypothetical protein